MLLASHVGTNERPVNLELLCLNNGLHRVPVACCISLLGFLGRKPRSHFVILEREPTEGVLFLLRFQFSKSFPPPQDAGLPFLQEIGSLINYINVVVTWKEAD